MSKVWSDPLREPNSGFASLARFAQNSTEYGALRTVGFAIVTCAYWLFAEVKSVALSGSLAIAPTWEKVGPLK
jgi:hypothetical protein